MSWQNDIERPLAIRTGDGSEFINVLWRNTSLKEITYNTAQFDFPKIQGSLILRGTPQARKFSLDIIFQGDNHLVDSLIFEKAANDPRPWTINHPIYGVMKVQPMSLKFDYSGYNTTHITGTILETITFGGPQITQVPREKVVFDKQQMDETVAIAYESEIIQLVPSTKDVNTLTGFNKLIYDLGVKSVQFTEDSSGYFNAFNAANAAIVNLSIAPLTAARALQTAINYPSQFVNTIQARINSIEEQFAALNNQIGTIITPSDKKNYEIIGETLVSSLALASVTGYDGEGNLVLTGDLPDYATKADIIAVIQALQLAYNTLLAKLDALQTSNGGELSSYVPNSDSLGQLDQLINFTIENLYQIAISAKQERIVILENDTNLIILAHRFYGLQADDSTIDYIIKTNSIGLNEMLQIRKGRQMSFYI